MSTAAERLKMKLYMRAYRAEGRGRGGVPRRPRGRRLPPPVMRPQRRQRKGHCTFCGLRSLADVCGFCMREITGVAA